jgi:hypothetical protein
MFMAESPLTTAPVGSMCSAGTSAIFALRVQRMAVQYC